MVSPLPTSQRLGVWASQNSRASVKPKTATEPTSHFDSKVEGGRSGPQTVAIRSRSPTGNAKPGCGMSSWLNEHRTTPNAHSNDFWLNHARQYPQGRAIANSIHFRVGLALILFSKNEVLTTWHPA